MTNHGNFDEPFYILYLRAAHLELITWRDERRRFKSASVVAFFALRLAILGSVSFSLHSSFPIFIFSSYMSPGSLYCLCYTYFSSFPFSLLIFSLGILLVFTYWFLPLLVIIVSPKLSLIFSSFYFFSAFFPFFIFVLFFYCSPPPFSVLHPPPPFPFPRLLRPKHGNYPADVSCAGRILSSQPHSTSVNVIMSSRFWGKS